MDNQRAPRARLRIGEVERRVGFKKSKIYQLIRSGSGAFPAPIIDGVVNYWDSWAVDDWVDAKLSSESEEDRAAAGEHGRKALAARTSHEVPA